MPGIYTLTYSVVNDDGYTATATRQLYVYQSVAITTTLAAYTDLPTLAQAQGLVADLRTKNSAGYTTGVQNVISRMGSLASGLEPGDVDLAGPKAMQQGPQNFSVQVNATVYLHLPKGVHRPAVQAFAALMAASRAGPMLNRPAPRLLLAGAAASTPPGGARSALEGVARHDTSSHSSLHSSVMGQLRMLRQSVGLLEQLLEPHVDCSESSNGATLPTCPARTPLASWGMSPAGVPSGLARRLLQSGQSSASLASLLADLGTALGATFSTQPLTAQAVDLLPVSRMEAGAIIAHMWHAGCCLAALPAAACRTTGAASLHRGQHR